MIKRDKTYEAVERAIADYVDEIDILEARKKEWLTSDNDYAVDNIQYADREIARMEGYITVLQGILDEVDNDEA